MSELDPLELSLRVAVAADARSLGVLGGQVFLETYAPLGIRPPIADEAREHFSTHAIARLLAQPATCFIVAEAAGHLIGFAQLTHGVPPPHAGLGTAADTAELERLYVLQRFTGRGVGSRLLREAEARAAADGAGALWLTAWVGNARALAFYAAQGFREDGRTVYDFQGELYENRVFAKTLRPA